MERKRWQTRLLAMLLTFMMVFTTPMNAMASGRAVENDEQTTTTPAADAKVTLTVGMKGDLATDKDGKVMLAREVTVKDTNKDGQLTYDEALAAAHEEFFEGGAEAGYESENSDSGKQLKKFWGDSSGAFGYWKNDTSCWSLSDEVEAGDCLTAFVYKDATGWSDAYARFDNENYLTKQEIAIECAYEKAEWDNSSMQFVFKPLDSATTLTAYDSDRKPLSEEDYKVEGNNVTFLNVGTYYLVATSTENNLIVPAVTKVKVKKNNDIAVKGITLNNSSLAMAVGCYDLTLKASLTPSNVSNVSVTWTSANPEIATVDNGKVSAKSVGETVITASVGNLQATCAVKVTDLPKLSSLKFYMDRTAYNAGKDPLKMTPEFDGNILKGYAVTAPDYVKTLYAEAIMKKEYVDAGHRSIWGSSSWGPTTGSSLYMNSETGIAKNDVYIWNNTMDISALNWKEEHKYRVAVSRYATLKSLDVNARMDSAFAVEQRKYQVYIDNAKEALTITPTAYANDYSITVNGAVVENEKGYTIPDYNWDENGKMTVDIVVGKDGIESTTYTLELIKTKYDDHKPVILTQPESADYVKIDTVKPLKVNAIADGNLGYQWYSNTVNSKENGTAIEGATEKEYTPGITLGTTYYYCVITNKAVETENVTISDVVSILVDEDPTPIATIKNPGSAMPSDGYEYSWNEGYVYQVGDTATALEVVATTKAKDCDLKYEWRRLTNAYNTSYTYSVSGDDKTRTQYTPMTTVDRVSTEGDFYACKVTCTFKGKEYVSWAKTGKTYTTGEGETAKINDVVGVYVFVKSDKAATPVIKVHPDDKECMVGDYLSLSISATCEDGGKLTYQWYVNTEDNTDNGTPIDGANRRYYALNVKEAGTKYYYCVVTNTNQGHTASVASKTAKITAFKGDVEKELEGSGTEESPYLIKSVQDYMTVADFVAEGTSFDGLYLRQEKNITLPKGWTPIGVTKDGSSNIQSGENLRAFSGILDGNGKTITIPEGGLPLLGYVNGAEVRNLNIYGKKIAGYGLVNNYVGIGLSGTGIIIDNVTLKSGSSTLESGLIGTYITTNGFGGCSAGFLATIKNCTIEDNVTIGYTKDKEMIGSIAGRIHGSIENCVSHATVYGSDYVGGIIGTRDNAMAPCIVSKSSFDGTVEASGEHAGGIVGGGYENSTAPNGIHVEITGCTASGYVKGKDKVGGILGADTYVAQAWNEYKLKGNSFTGTVEATNGSYVGGIIGYYNSLNKYDDICNNYYSPECGAEKGIGFVKYVDTSCTTHETASGALYFSTEKDTKGCPAVAGCDWKKQYNRTDDPLGADADKLASNKTKVTKYVDELEISGTYKTDYYLGEELDLTGMKIVAYYSDGETKEVALSDLTIKGYDNTTRGNQELILGYEGATAEITVRVLKKAGKVRVQFQLLGDKAHGTSGEEHTLMHKNLETWIPNGFYELDENSTVYDLLKKVEEETEGLTINSRYNSTYKSQYIYGMVFKGVTLDELTNGANSGWMYTLNGKHVQVGVSNQYLEDGDVIVFHYTDNYTLEESEEYDQEQVDSAVEAVNSIPALDKLTKDDVGLVKRVRNAYENLSDAQKKLFPAEMLAKLEAAEAKIKELTEASDSTGSTDSTETHVHKWDAGVVTKAATCTADGVMTYTCTCGETKTEAIKAAGHKFGEWTKAADATITTEEKQQRVCSVCQHVETKDGAKAKATIKVTASTITLKTKQKTNKFKVTGLAKGDAVKQYKSSNKKIFTVTKKGVITAGKKAGKATLTITLKSGLKKKVTVKVQKKAVAPTKITGLKSKVSLKKGKKLTLKPTVKPFTCVQKVTYTSSKKDVATVSSKGTIKAIKAGKTKITVKCGNRRFVVNVTVTKK